MNHSDFSSFKIAPGSFQQDVLEASNCRVVLVFFWAPWCGLCRQLIPQVEEIVLRSNDTISLGLADVRDMREQGQALGMRGLPSIFAFRNGECVDEILGSPPITFFQGWVNRLIAEENAVHEPKQYIDPQSVMPPVV